MLCDSLFDLDRTLAAPYLKGKHPWEVLPHLGEVLWQLGEALPGEQYQEVERGIWISHTACVADTARIYAPCIVGGGCEVRHGAYLRGSTLLGKECVVGNSTEIKNSILFDGVKAPHFNYVGDSILGYGVHLGAGVILSNLRSDRGQVTVRETPPVPTGLKKLGGMLGDLCEVGCHAVINPGTVLGRGCVVMPLTSVRGVWVAGSRISGRGV